MSTTQKNEKCKPLILIITFFIPVPSYHHPVSYSTFPTFYPENAYDSHSFNL